MPQRLRTRSAACLLGLWLLSGCAATFRDPRVLPGEEKSQWAHFYVLGALGEAEVDVRDHCATARAQEIWIGEDVFTLAVSVLSLGIYTPRKVAITCARAATAPNAGAKR